MSEAKKDVKASDEKEKTPVKADAAIEAVVTGGTLIKQGAEAVSGRCTCDSQMFA